MTIDSGATPPAAYMSFVKHCMCSMTRFYGTVFGVDPNRYARDIDSRPKVNLVTFLIECM